MWPGNSWCNNRDSPKVNIFCTLSASKVFWLIFVLNSLLKAQDISACWNRGRYHSFRTIAVTRSYTNIMQHRSVFIGAWENSLATFSQRYKLTERTKRVTLKVRGSIYARFISEGNVLWKHYFFQSLLNSGTQNSP